jgi:hypothetical protein
MRPQFNVRIQKRLVKQVADDRTMAPTTKDVIVEVALENFFTKFSIGERRKFYHAHSRKPYQKAAA